MNRANRVPLGLFAFATILLLLFTFKEAGLPGLPDWLLGAGLTAMAVGFFSWVLSI